jgi:5-formyltetrahydrofolate cyclo-ligase
MNAFNPQPGRIFALYRARGDEFSPAPLAAALHAKSCLCAYPVVLPGSRIMRFAFWQEGDPLERGPYGIDQPLITPESPVAVPHIVVLPLLAWDGQGTRLGYGGGYYDATLEALRQKDAALAVGLAFEEQKSPDLLPLEPHDIPLDWIVTPAGAHKFTR